MRQVLLQRSSRCLARLETMVAISNPRKLNSLRKFILPGLIGRTEWVARSLANQRRGLEGFQMLGAQLVGLSGRMERIAQANDAVDFLIRKELVGDHAGDAPAH